MDPGTLVALWSKGKAPSKHTVSMMPDAHTSDSAGLYSSVLPCRPPAAAIKPAQYQGATGSLCTHLCVGDAILEHLW